MSAVREEVISCLSDHAWKQLADLEEIHRHAQLNHERVVRCLNEAIMAPDRRELQLVWNQYRAVVANLSLVTEEIESLRFNLS